MSAPGRYEISLAGVGAPGVIFDAVAVKVPDAIGSIKCERDTSEPEIQHLEYGVRISHDDGRWLFYPWANIIEVRFAPPKDGSGT